MSRSATLTATLMTSTGGLLVAVSWILTQDYLVPGAGAAYVGFVALLIMVDFGLAGALVGTRHPELWDGLSRAGSQEDERPRS